MQPDAQHQLVNWEIPNQNLDDAAKIIRRKVIELAEFELTRENPRVAEWFVEKNLEVVEDRVNWVLANCTRARNVNPALASILVWTHDYGRIIGHSDHHHVISALAIKQLLQSNCIDEDIAEQLGLGDLRHRAKSGLMPETKLEWVIASADALSHFDGAETESVSEFVERDGFWCQIWKEALSEGKDVNQIMAKSLNKMERDANSKQGFPESRARAQKEFEWLKDNMLEVLLMMAEG